MLEPKMGKSKSKKRRLQTPPSSPPITRSTSLTNLSSHPPTLTIPRSKRSCVDRKSAAAAEPVGAATLSLSPGSKVVCSSSYNISDSESYISGVISDSDNSVISPVNKVTDPSTNVLPSLIPAPAILCSTSTNAAYVTPSNSQQTLLNPPLSVINSHSFISNLPSDVRKLHMVSLSQSFTLSKLNPIKLGQAIHSVCGNVENIQHLKSGGIFITCISFPQVEKLLHVSILPFASSNISVKVSVALNSQSVQGKIYAPELLDESLSDLCTALRPSSVVDVRKLLNDPTKTHVPLFVLTFFGSTCPQYITLGFSRYRVDPFYPSPSRCSQCCQWGHTRGLCRGSLTCSSCGNKGHSSANCTSQSLSCPNCGGSHSAFSRQCPQSIKEHHICQIKTKNNISYTDARKIFSSQDMSTDKTRPSPPSTSTASASALPLSQFPVLLPSHLSQVSQTSATSEISPSPWFPPQQPAPSYLPSQSPSILSQMVLPSPTKNLTYAQTAAPDSQNSFPSTSELPSTASLYKCLPSESNALNIPSSTKHVKHPLSQSTAAPARPSTTSVTPFSIDTLSQCLAPVIPLLIKLLLSSSLSSKLECVLEIASLFNLEDSVNSAISSLGFSSLSSSQ